MSFGSHVCQILLKGKSALSFMWLCPALLLANNNAFCACMLAFSMRPCWSTQKPSGFERRPRQRFALFVIGMRACVKHHKVMP